MNEIINVLYKNNIELILKDFDENDQSEIKKEYLDYLTLHYSRLVNEEYNSSDIIDVIDNMEKDLWLKKKKIEKQRILLKDEKLDKMGEISNIGYENALKKLECLKNNIEYKNNLNKVEVELYIDNLTKLSNEVRDFNKEIADRYLSEGILDLLFAANMSENTSFRIGNIK